MLNPWFWLEPFFQTPKDTMAEAEAAEQKHAEEMINPVPTLRDELPHNRAQALRAAINDWRYDNQLDAEVSNVEIADLYERLHVLWVDQQIDADREKTTCGR